MKKLFILFAVLMICALSTIAAEQYEGRSYNNLMKNSMNTFVSVYNRLNNCLNVSNNINKRNYTKFEEVWNYAIKSNISHKNIPNGIQFNDITNVAVKYTKLKDTCQKAPKNPGPETACAKLIVDTNGFDRGENKNITEVTVRPKEQYVLYLYSDAIRPIVGSTEDSIIFMKSRY